ncbi:hypothetical protein GCM10023231_02690 [Olivibacter ginsenosidimutans]|uniref:BZIP transcription factor n=1 Tax=Olivibacter ginsenosidimutans TaxID=1176537 RepID=A0ABP9AE41_9SPHI
MKPLTVNSYSFRLSKNRSSIILSVQLLTAFCLVFFQGKVAAQVQTGVFKTSAGNTDYHFFTRNGNGTAVYMNQIDNTNPILRLSSGTATANQNVKFTVENNGKVGIGTTKPSQMLHVIGSVAAQGSYLSYNPDNPSASVALSWLDNVARIRVGGTGDGAGNGLDIQSHSDISLMRLLSNGNVGIGTTDPKAKLAVNGNILAKEIKVKTDITVPDYVFEANYQLPSLTEVEAYVKEHKHLPEIPSAKEIGEKGLDLAEMNLLLLKKVEELTLRLILKEKEVNQQNERISKLEKLFGQ